MIDHHRGESLNMVKVGDSFINDFFAPILNQGGDSDAQFLVLPTDLKRWILKVEVMGECCFDVIARNVFVLPNTRFFKSPR